MNESLGWKLCLILGIATFVMVGVIFPMFPPDGAAANLRYGEPIYAFEFARSKEDLLLIFGDMNDLDRSLRLDMMDRGNRWDYLFMSLYSAFGAVFGRSLYRAGFRIGLLILTAAMIGGLADAVETSLLLSITSDLRAGISPAAALTWLSIPVGLKFAAIGATIAGAASIYFRRKRPLWQLTALTLLSSALIACVAALGVPIAVKSVGIAIGVGWLGMMFHAGVTLYEHRRSERQTGRQTTPPLP